jgi:nudix-type nucleoside diphosphatase (YffH/AdpP family)
MSSALSTCRPVLLVVAPINSDQASPAERIRAEAEEETGYRVHDVEPIFEAYMSPGSVTEKLYFFTGRYTPANQVSDGGGHAEEGEEIEVVEIGIDAAMAMIRSGEIKDGKTIMLLQHAALHIFKSPLEGERVSPC